MALLLINSQLADRLQEGGSFMYIILVGFLLSLFFIVMAFVKRNKNAKAAHKHIQLANEASIFTLAMGCFASVFGIIELFDMVEALGNVKPNIFSAGLKVSMLTIIFGLFSFTVARIGILAYKWSSKSNDDE